jgi:hypothetical protein
MVALDSGVYQGGLYMGKKRLSKADARACVRLVEAALRDGYPLKNAPGKPSALSMAYERFCTKNGDVIGQRAFNVRFQEAKRRFGLEPKLPKNPKPDPTVKVMAPSRGGRDQDRARACGHARRCARQVDARKC